MRYFVSLENENGLVLDKKEVFVIDWDEKVLICNQYEDIIGELELNPVNKPVNAICKKCGGEWATCKCLLN